MKSNVELIKGNYGKIIELKRNQSNKNQQRNNNNNFQIKENNTQNKTDENVTPPKPKRIIKIKKEIKKPPHDLDEQIDNLLKGITPTEHEIEIKNKLFERIKNLVNSVYKGKKKFHAV